MPEAVDTNLLDALLDAWDRNNRILINLLRSIPPGQLGGQAAPGSPSVAQMFTHIHYVRLVFLSEDLPELSVEVPDPEWRKEQDPEKIAAALEQSGTAVRQALAGCIRSGKPMQVHYDHPLLFLEHMIWHEGYHHGQIKLALKINGHPLENKDMGPLTWRVWMDKTPQAD